MVGPAERFVDVAELERLQAMVRRDMGDEGVPGQRCERGRRDADRKAVAAALKPIYRAATETEGLRALDEFASEWDARYPTIARSWRANWSELSPFFAFPDEIRRAIYTTNAIESMNYSLRKILKNRSLFPNDEAVEKLVYLALRVYSVTVE